MTGELSDVVELLRCPVCAGSFGTPESGAGPARGDSVTRPARLVSLRCDNGHTFDVARQGYVSLLDGRSASLRADTAAMVAARARVHDTGFFTCVVDAVADRTRRFGTDVPRPVVLDAGAGGGHYLRAAVAALGDDARGIGIDLSKYCARAIARGTPPHAAIVADIWRGLPMADEGVTVALSVFAPRNGTEFARVLRPDGALIVVSPEADHLAEVVGPMKMLRVDAAKSERLHAALDEHFEVIESAPVRAVVDVDAATVGDLVAMGPSAFHSQESDIRSRAADLVGTGTIPVTVSVLVTTCRPKVRGRRAVAQRSTD